MLDFVCGSPLCFVYEAATAVMRCTTHIHVLQYHLPPTSVKKVGIWERLHFTSAKCITANKINSWLFVKTFTGL